MNNINSTPGKKLDLPAQDFLNYLLICLMMVCFSIVIVNAITSAIPSWNGSYLALLAFLVSVESITSSRLIKNFTALNSNPFTVRITEWIVILVFAKLLKYLLTDPSQLLIDINLWSQNFGSFFIKDDYLLVCIFLLFIWLLSTAFMNCLNSFDVDIDLLDLERQGFARANRSEARRGMIGLVFGIGFVMLFLTTISNTPLPFIRLPSSSILVNISLILLFFLMGFIILAQSQSTILRARWHIENIPINSTVASRWIIFSISFAMLIAFVAFFLALLPTTYSLGFFDLLRSLLNILFALFTLLQLVCLAPLALLFSLVMRLFGQGTPPPAAGIQLPTPIPLPPTAPPTTNSWIELFKSIFFWAIFLLIIIFAFRHYLSQRQGLTNSFRRLPLWGWIKGAFKWVWTQFLHVNRRLSIILDASAARFRALRKTNPIHFDPLLTISSRLPPRQRILLIYLSMIRWNNRNGFPRKGNQTPLEYARALNSSLPESQMDLDTITKAFIEARYTRHTLTHDEADQVQSTLEHLQSVFSEYLSQEQTMQEEK